MTGVRGDTGVDKDLVARVIGGDREAYRVLVEKYQNRALAIALEIVKSREDAEDIVQESFVKAYLSLGEFRNQSAFYTWLYRIVYNMAIDFKRKMVRRGGDTLEYDEVSGTAGSEELAGRVAGPHEAIVEKEQRARIARVVAELSPEHRAVIVLREVEGLSYDEIARVTGVTKGTVMSRLHYARKRMQGALHDLAPEGAGVVEEEGLKNKVNESG
jgi:RNA polymerase sigma-70 factor (ECF subfamily)